MKEEEVGMHSSATAIDSSIYRDIFTTPAMRAVWSDERRVQYYLDVEKALSLVQGRLGVIPQNAAAEIARHCTAREIDFVKLKAATERVGFPIMPVVQQLTALCGDGLGQWCHWGATTQDITDTATVLQMRAGLELVERDMLDVIKELERLAREHRDTPMVGRSHLQQAVPMTFGYKVAVWLSGFQRQLERFNQMKPRVLIGELAGAVGTLASLEGRGFEVQDAVMDELGLGRPPIAWHTMRDTICEAGCFLGLLCGLLEKIALDVKLMMMTELDEVAEPAGAGHRGGSSTMPQKRNPISCAYITACAGVVRQHVAGLLTAMGSDLERATGPWEIEWLVLPEIFCYTAGALAQAKFMLGGLEVHPDSMLKNLQITDGLINTENVMMALGPKMGREIAHDRIADICVRVAKGEGRLIDLLAADSDIAKIFDRAALEKLLDPRSYVGLSAAMVDRVLKR
jgi:3-carboxy-cis,cis-muconate cycloisomerase